MRIVPLDVEGPFASRDLISRLAPIAASGSFSSVKEETDEQKGEIASDTLAKLASGRNRQQPRTPASLSPPKRSLDWEFKGLTLWLELRDSEQDEHVLSRALDYAETKFGTERIPLPHVTAIYGMTHLSVNEAKAKLQSLKNIGDGSQSKWPDLDPALGLTVDRCWYNPDIPSHFCSMAWVEITYPTNSAQEAKMAELYEVFDVPAKERVAPWSPHVSLAYDNPDDTVLQMDSILPYVANQKSLWGSDAASSKPVSGISLWDTNGRMCEWKCLDRVSFESNSSTPDLETTSR